MYANFDNDLMFYGIFAIAILLSFTKIIFGTIVPKVFKALDRVVAGIGSFVLWLLPIVSSLMGQSFRTIRMKLLNHLNAEQIDALSPSYCEIIFADLQGRKFVIEKGIIVREDGKTFPVGKDPEAQINNLLRSGNPTLFQTAFVLMRELFIPEFKVPVAAGMGATRLARVERPAELMTPTKPARIAGPKVLGLPWDRTIYVPAEKTIHLPHDPS